LATCWCRKPPNWRTPTCAGGSPPHRQALISEALPCLELKPALASLERRRGQRINTVQAYLAARSLQREPW